MSIMDQEAIFLPYGEGIAAFLMVLGVYVIAPRGKILTSVAFVLLAAPLYFGVKNLTEGVAAGSFAGLLLALAAERAWEIWETRRQLFRA